MNKKIHFFRTFIAAQRAWEELEELYPGCYWEPSLSKDGTCWYVKRKDA